jgi:hypothetical protein
MGSLPLQPTPRMILYSRMLQEMNTAPFRLRHLRFARFEKKAGTQHDDHFDVAL